MVLSILFNREIHTRIAGPALHIYTPHMKLTCIAAYTCKSVCLQVRSTYSVLSVNCQLHQHLELPKQQMW